MPAPHPPFRLKPQKLKVSENDVESACIDVLRFRGYWVIRQHSGLFKTPDGKRWIRIGEAGIPDYAAIHTRYPGFLLEVKRPGQDLDPAQKEKVAELRLGYRLAVAVVDSAALLVVWLNAHEKKANDLWHESATSNRAL